MSDSKTQLISHSTRIWPSPNNLYLSWQSNGIDQIIQLLPLHKLVSYANKLYNIRHKMYQQHLLLKKQYSISKIVTVITNFLNLTIELSKYSSSLIFGCGLGLSWNNLERIIAIQPFSYLIKSKLKSHSFNRKCYVIHWLKIFLNKLQLFSFLKRLSYSY